MINHNRVNFKVVVNSPELARGVFYNPVTLRQLAVLTHGGPRRGYKLSIPIEGMGGWHVVLPSFWRAQQIAQREMSFCGRLYNRTVFMLIAFFRYKLH